LIAVSPWSKGGWVNSQVFDHTSMIRFIEKRFEKEHPDLIEPNITKWRRAVAGDLTSIFDFATPNDHRVTLPSTAGYLPPDLLPHDTYPVTPSNVVMGVPNQEPGSRPARALPYELNVYGAARFNDKSMRLVFENTGDATAVFHVRSGNPSVLPRSYTVEANKSLADAWTVTESYDLSVYGPNGFFRSFKGSVAARTVRAKLDVRASYNTGDQGGITLRIINSGEHTAKLSIVNAYTGESSGELLAPREDMDHEWSLSATHGWYDLIIRITGDDAFEYRLAGHVETGRDSMSDPALGGLVLKS
jgi:phospholipase C